MEKKIIKRVDKKIAKLIEDERRRQEETLNLIASENYPSRAVREALGSIFIAKYAEGRPYKRYYGGMENVDRLERLVEERVRRLFGLKPEEWAVNVQALSGSPANYAILRALLKPGERILSLHLLHGGHLSHGANVSLTGQDFSPVYYYLDQNGLLNYKEIERLALKEKPKLIFCGYTAYPRKIDFKKFGQIAKRVGAYLFADISHIAGLIVGKVHPSPFPFADVVMTTTHKTLRGPRGAIIICKKEFEDKIFKKVFPGLQGGPHIHTICAIGISLREAMNPNFKKYASQIVENARVLASHLQKYEFSLVSGGTDNHLLLVDLRNKNITGGSAQRLLERAGIVTNKNSIPYDPRPPFDPSGLRLGTAAVTTRGMGEREMEKIAFWIDKVISRPHPVSKIKKEVKKLCQKFPIP